ncbi:MAG: hypothetical protein AB7S78_00090 [Candidatus Omnitrophota bacterium]
MKLKTAFILCLIVVSAVSCENRRLVRVYEEVTTNPEPPVMKNPHGSMPMNRGMDFQAQDPAMQAMLTNSVAGINLTWTVPAGWTEQKGTGMRLATFTTSGENPIDCSVVSLSGPSGGLEANVKRWLGQIALDLPDEEFETFMSAQETFVSAGQLNIRLIDFRPLYPFKDDLQPSIVAGIIELEQQTVFIKLTGSLRALNVNQEKFKDLLMSLKMSDE